MLASNGWSGGGGGGGVLLSLSLFMPQRREAEGRRSFASTRRPIDSFSFNTSAGQVQQGAAVTRLHTTGGRGVEDGAPAGG